ncbi:hypothetical protein PI125_g21367 [Phytophthora idaei]|nr:hypothetical protein PI125_g21367 [Phytophthora idaei]
MINTCKRVRWWVALSTTILLDTGAIVRVISERLTKKLRLRAVPNHGRSIDVQGIGKCALTTKRRVLVYELEMWLTPESMWSSGWTS